VNQYNKRFSDLCGEEIFYASVSWLQQGVFPPQLNNIDIVLIFKKDNPTPMKDLRPISLGNILYKIVSKVIANRLNFFFAKYIFF